MLLSYFREAQKRNSSQKNICNKKKGNDRKCIVLQERLSKLPTSVVVAGVKIVPTAALGSAASALQVLDGEGPRLRLAQHV